MSATQQIEMTGDEELPVSPSLKKMPKQDDLHEVYANSNGTADTTHGGPVVIPKYKHVMAVHSKRNTSCLTHGSHEVSFAGFRNLMVLVIGMAHHQCHIAWLTNNSRVKLEAHDREFSEGVQAALLSYMPCSQLTLAVRCIDLHRVPRLPSSRPRPWGYAVLSSTMSFVHRIYDRALCRASSRTCCGRS